jgi:hypothetical protein
MYKVMSRKVQGIQFRLYARPKRRPRSEAPVREIKPTMRAKEQTAGFADMIRDLRAKGMRDSDRIAALFNQGESRTPWGTPWSGAAIDAVAGPPDYK